VAQAAASLVDSFHDGSDIVLPIMAVMLSGAQEGADACGVASSALHLRGFLVLASPLDWLSLRR